MRTSSVQPLPVRPSPPRPILRVAPEPMAPPTRQVPLAAAIGLVVLALLLGAAGMYWQHASVTDRNLTTAALVRGVNSLNAQLGVQEAKVAATQQMVLTQDQLMQDLQIRNAALRMRYGIAIGNERAAEQALATSQAELQAANHTVQTLVGAPLADGSYVGYLMAVGSQQSPPRLVIDRAKMVSGQLVNDSPAWRTIPIDPTAEVVVLSLQPYHPQPISLDRLAHLFVNPAPWADPVTHAPFRIIVSGGIVTSISEIQPTA